MKKFKNLIFIKAYNFLNKHKKVKSFIVKFLNKAPRLKNVLKKTIKPTQNDMNFAIGLNISKKDLSNEAKEFYNLLNKNI